MGYYLELERKVVLKKWFCPGTWHSSLQNEIKFVFNGIYYIMVWIKSKFLWPEFSPGLSWLAHYTCVGNMLLLTLYKELCPVLWVTWWHGCKPAGEQSRGWSGGSTEDRGPEDGCSGWLCKQRGPEDGCAGRKAHRQRPACCMQTRSEWTGF